MAKYALGLVLGAIVGFGVAFVALPDDPPIEDDRDLEGEVSRLERSLSDRDAKLDEAKKARSTAEDERDAAVADLKDLTSEVARGRERTGATIPDAPVGTGGEPEDAAPAALGLDGLRKKAMELDLQKLILGGGEKEKAAIREAFAGASAETLTALIDEFRTAGSMGIQLKLAHALAQSGRPEAINALRDTLLDSETGLILRRTASHGLAFAQNDGIDADLLRLAREDADTGVRANLAFGLAKRGHADGVRLYVEATDAAFEKKDPAALQYLGGLSLLGDDAKPFVRERLETYKGQQERLVLIQYARAGKDKEALSTLDRIAQSDESPDIRAAAKEAASSIRGE